MSNQPTSAEAYLHSRGIPALDQCAGQADYDAAFRDITSIVGPENIARDSATRDEFAKTSLPAGTKPGGVVRPASTEEVCEVVKIAQRCSVPLHAISCGKNWGYGDKCATADGRLIVDLARMSRIRELNVELGYAVIEPGVTQGQMHEYLQNQNSPLVLDVTGAGPDASIVGNLLQGGFGHSLYGDRFRHTCGMEVVLADGSVLNTGYGDASEAKAARVYPYGIGPCIDGIFRQSNFGIVTSACVWLMPRPQVIEGFAMLFDDKKLGAVIEALRRLRMSGTVRSTVHVANDLRVLSSRIRFPWDQADTSEPLPDDLRAALRREHGLGDWNMLGGLFGTKQEVRAARSVVRRGFRSAGRVQFFRRSHLNLACKVGSVCSWFGPARRLQETAINVGNAFDLLEGSPSKEHLHGAFWGSRTTSDDIRDVGLIWVSPVIPMTQDAAHEVNQLASSTLNRFGFDYLVTMTAITERAMVCVISINFDKASEREREAATNCTRELLSELKSRGYHSYRRSSITV